MRFWLKKIKVCLVIIISLNFVLGILVMLYFFLKYNGWFKGDIFIYVYDLLEEDCVCL